MKLCKVFHTFLLTFPFRNLLMPLRASNLSYNDLRHVVILGNLEFLRRYNFNYLLYFSSPHNLKIFFTVTSSLFSLPITECTWKVGYFRGLCLHNVLENGICWKIFLKYLWWRALRWVEQTSGLWRSNFVRPASSCQQR